MSQTRYRLTTQLHFPANTPSCPDAIITVQRWDSITTGKPLAVYVSCVNGIETRRVLCTTPADFEHLSHVIAATATDHGDTLLSEEAACTEVTRRGGPRLRWCHQRDCGEPVPYAASQCALGHPTDSVGRVETLAARRNGPPITWHTGGQNRG